MLLFPLKNRISEGGASPPTHLRHAPGAWRTWGIICVSIWGANPGPSLCKALHYGATIFQLFRNGEKVGPFVVIFTRIELIILLNSWLFIIILPVPDLFLFVGWLVCIYVSISFYSHSHFSSPSNP